MSCCGNLYPAAGHAVGIGKMREDDEASIPRIVHHLVPHGTGEVGNKADAGWLFAALAHLLG